MLLEVVKKVNRLIEIKVYVKRDETGQLFFSHEESSEFLEVNAKFLSPGWKLSNHIESPAISGILGLPQIDRAKLYENRLKYLLKDWNLKDEYPLDFENDSDNFNKLTDESYEAIVGENGIDSKVINQFLILLDERL